MTFILGCKKEEGLKLMKIGEQVFETDFIPSSKFSGYYLDSKTGIEYLYLSNGTTDKKVSFFTLNGELIKTIDFKTATKGHQLEDISIWSLDTILALSSTIPVIIFAINDIGKCVKKLEVEKLLKKNIFPKTYISSSGDDDFLHDKNLYLYRGFKMDIDTTKSYLEYLITAYNLKRDLPYLIKVANIFTETPIVTFLIDSFYSRFIPKNHFITDIPDYDFYNNLIHVISFQVDCLYVYDQDGNHQHTVALDYKNKAKQNLKYDNLEKYYERDLAEFSNWNTANLSYVSNLFYDVEHERYYVVAYHNYEGLESKSWYLRNWSMLIYDKNFIFLDEIIIKNPKTRILFSFLTSKGWFSKKNKHYIKNYDPYKTHFDIYTVE